MGRLMSEGGVRGHDVVQQLPPLGELRLRRASELDHLAVDVHEERRHLALEGVRELGEGGLVDPAFLAVLEAGLHRRDAPEDQHVLDAPGVVARVHQDPPQDRDPPEDLLQQGRPVEESRATCSV
jgi:hypothetical protein